MGNPGKVMRKMPVGPDKLGGNGFETARQRHIDVAVEREKTMPEEAMPICE